MWTQMPAQPKPENDEPVKVPLDPEEALRALLKVRPDPSVEKKTGEGLGQSVEGG